ncbi:hypothetical protein NN561_012207 [Cricetulus griseus]
MVDVEDAAVVVARLLPACGQRQLGALTGPRLRRHRGHRGCGDRDGGRWRWRLPLGPVSYTHLSRGRGCGGTEGTEGAGTATGGAGGGGSRWDLSLIHISHGAAAAAAPRAPRVRGPRRGALAVAAPAGTCLLYTSLTGPRLRRHRGHRGCGDRDGGRWRWRLPLGPVSYTHLSRGRGCGGTEGTEGAGTATGGAGGGGSRWDLSLIHISHGAAAAAAPRAPRVRGPRRGALAVAAPAGTCLLYTSLTGPRLRRHRGHRGCGDRDGGRWRWRLPLGPVSYTHLSRGRGCGGTEGTEGAGTATGGAGGGGSRWDLSLIHISHGAAAAAAPRAPRVRGPRRGALAVAAPAGTCLLYTSLTGPRLRRHRGHRGCGDRDGGRWRWRLPLGPVSYTHLSRGRGCGGTEGTEGAGTATGGAGGGGSRWDLSLIHISHGAAAAAAPRAPRVRGPRRGALAVAAPAGTCLLYTSLTGPRLRRHRGHRGCGDRDGGRWRWRLPLGPVSYTHLSRGRGCGGTEGTEGAGTATGGAGGGGSRWDLSLIHISHGAAAAAAPRAPRVRGPRRGALAVAAPAGTCLLYTSLTGPRLRRHRGHRGCGDRDGGRWRWRLPLGPVSYTHLSRGRGCGGTEGTEGAGTATGGAGGGGSRWDLSLIHISHGAAAAAAPRAPRVRGPRRGALAVAAPAGTCLLYTSLTGPRLRRHRGHRGCGDRDGGRWRWRLPLGPVSYTHLSRGRGCGGTEGTEGAGTATGGAGGGGSRWDLSLIHISHGAAAAAAPRAPRVRGPRRGALAVAAPAGTCLLYTSLTGPRLRRHRGHRGCGDRDGGRWRWRLPLGPVSYTHLSRGRGCGGTEGTEGAGTATGGAGGGGSRWDLSLIHISHGAAAAAAPRAPRVRGPRRGALAVAAPAGTCLLYTSLTGPRLRRHRGHRGCGDRDGGRWRWRLPLGPVSYTHLSRGRGCGGTEGTEGAGTATGGAGGGGSRWDLSLIHISHGAAAAAAPRAPRVRGPRRGALAVAAPAGTCLLYTSLTGPRLRRHRGHRGCGDRDGGRWRWRLPLGPVSYTHLSRGRGCGGTEGTEGAGTATGGAGGGGSRWDLSLIHI